MTRDERDSLVEIMSKVQIRETRGSLLSAVDRLLRVIDISENAIMIPTLLKDKCEFDAYEILTMARILKASILGHNDLVEFYMSESSLSFNSKGQQQSSSQQLSIKQPPQLHQQQPKSTHTMITNNNNNNTNNNNNNNNSSNINSNSNHNHYNIMTISNQSQLQLQSTTPSLASSSSLDSSTSSSPTPLRSSISDGLLNLGSTLHSGTSNSASSSSSQSQTMSSTMITSASQIPGGDDPDITVRLLLQIESLKTFIPQVTNLFESIIELYKNSVDTSYT